MGNHKLVHYAPKKRNDILGKERVDRHSEALYFKDWESLTTPQAKYRALARALNEAEQEILTLKSKLSELPESKPC